MHKYFLKTPWWVPLFYPAYTWRMPDRENVVYLTFDDGPHPEITPWVLDQLKHYNAAATFFCIGRNVEQYPGVYQQILAEGHSTGNHTYSHPNGWKTPAADYLQDVTRASIVIDSSLFRPPYGRVKKKQAAGLAEAMQKRSVKLVMWDVLSADFDRSVSPEQCAAIVVRHVRPGSVVVFHDSEKAFRNLEFALPYVLENLKTRGFCFRKL